MLSDQIFRVPTRPSLERGGQEKWEQFSEEHVVQCLYVPVSKYYYFLFFSVLYISIYTYVEGLEGKEYLA